MKKYLKPILTVTILALTVVSFIYYTHKHPEIVDRITQMPPLTLVAIVLLYGVWFIWLALVTRASLHIYKKHMGLQENFLFNAYSSLINFFGPGQSGPLFRGAYLKKRHSLGIKPYIFTLLIYYAFYGVISVLMVLIGTRPWWQTALLVPLAAAGSVVILRWYKNKNRAKMGDDKPFLGGINLGLLFGATVFQLTSQVAIFAIELHNVGAHASFSQVLAYSGVANMALFVALTPGAIGIREGFLAFSQNLHHIGGNTIVAANVVDRGAYLVFLGILFLLVIGLHAKDKLQIKQLNLKQPKDS
ncbi:MAG TPA: lysylphosphatidylglycerol synthase transmembrane domain-containing protein [Patescibacteria group bacterium]|nr:lysylphosphatidylglycerol synthase transmembrane domain-containing protein [Patescibacteria group bacterium]